MAVTTEGIDKAEVALCVELDGAYERPLPWAFVKFADVSETNRYVMPASNGLHLLAAQPFRVRKEAMRGQAFPHEMDFGPRPITGDESKFGPQAIHFFGTAV